MKKFTKLILVALLFFGMVAGGTWILSQIRDYEGVMDERTQRCVKLGESIKKQIIAANYCIKDEECKAANIRCPWGSGKGKCRYILANRNHSVSLLQTDAMGYLLCAAEHEQLKEKLRYCAEERKQTAECPDLTILNLKCIDNRCVEVK